MTHATATKSIVSVVQARANLRDWTHAEHTTTQVLRALGHTLRTDERALFAKYLPDRLAEILRRPSQLDDSADRVYASVAVAIHAPPLRAREITHVVAQALTELLHPDERSRFIRDLPVSLVALYAIPTTDSMSTDVGAPPSVNTDRQTLSSGRPGSFHPLSESSGDRTQSHSVVREDNPHADSKLSSAQGLTQEQLHESLATVDRPRKS